MAAAVASVPSIEGTDFHDSSPDKHLTNPAVPVTPPATDESSKGRGSVASELTELDMLEQGEGEEDDEEEEIEPDHYYGDGKIPVFKPTMDQFRSFKKFVEKIDKYGMRSGIVKVIPPKEWIDSLPQLDEAVKTIRIKNPITQEFGGAHGTYTQANIEKQRSYNLPQWKALTEESQHQPPARRGERRLNQAPVRGPPRNTAATADTGVKSENETENARRRGRPRRSNLSNVDVPSVEDREEEPNLQAPPTPTSPEMPEQQLPKKRGRPFGSTNKAREASANSKSPASRPGAGRGSQAKSVAERRKYNQADTTKSVDEAAFKGFDYRFHHNDEFTKERCAELEEKYWKSLNFAPPMYGGDMPGSLFDNSTTSWNVAKLENLLDVLGQKIPGVNTTYLYLGMWKATFAWHLEDVDLYSINYIHFGAPKQWYSISQEDARRFENAMKSIWPSDAKSCSQFLRHKTYLISPDLLQRQFNIKVNKLVHYEGEFVITFPYGYHSGYNLGYNCAESVNFATESWLDFGRISKKCDCEADSVWVDVGEIERKLRGEPTLEYEEYTDEEDDMDDGADHLPSPPASVKGKLKAAARGKKRKRNEPAQGQKVVKKLKIRIRPANFQLCMLCPNHIPSEPLLPTDTGKQAHRCCALYTPETSIVEENGVEMVCNVSNIDRARLDLKCNCCRSKVGSCFQCSSRKCIRAYHATCAAAAGVQVDFGPMAVYGEDGTEYKSEGYDFRCKFHRARRPKGLTTEGLEGNNLIRKKAAAVQPGQVVQMQYLGGDVFAGTVVENRSGERCLLLDILPDGDRVEVEWKYLLALDPEDSQLLRPSPAAVPLPEHLSKQMLPERSAEFGPPQEGDLFTDSASSNKWSEFHTAPVPHNRDQAKVDFAAPNHVWHYLGSTSTEARPQFTEDPEKQRNNPASNYLETVRHLLAPGQGPKPQAAKPATKPVTGWNTNQHALNAVARKIPGFGSSSHSTYTPLDSPLNALARPYEFKPRTDFAPIRPQTTQLSPLDRYLNCQNIGKQAPSFPSNPYSAISQPSPIGDRPYIAPSPSGQHNMEWNRSRSGSQSQGNSVIQQSNWSRPQETGMFMKGEDREREQRLQKYPFLHRSFVEQLVSPDGPPRPYRSPYTETGGFSDLYCKYLSQHTTLQTAQEVVSKTQMSTAAEPGYQVDFVPRQSQAPMQQYDWKSADLQPNTLQGTAPSHSQVGNAVFGLGHVEADVKRNA